MARSIRRPRSNSGDTGPKKTRHRFGPRYSAGQLTNRYMPVEGAWWVFDWLRNRNVTVVEYEIDARMTAAELNATAKPRVVRYPF